jgi:hypothetical protein
MLDRIVTAQVSDTTDDASSNAVDKKENRIET